MADEPASRIITGPLDGGDIEVYSTGSGPGVVVVQGGGVDASAYRKFAQRLSQHFTVHRYNRRGRGRSAQRTQDYSLATEIGDLGAVLTDMGSTRVIGHSVGGFFALVAARELPIRRLALFDPTINVDEMFPSDFMPEFERLIAVGDTVDAMVVMGKALNNAGTHWPLFVQRAAVRLVMLTPAGKTMGQLLPTVPAESQLAIAAGGPASDWAGVDAMTRFYIGQRSPSYYAPIAQELVAAMPNATIEIVPRQGHDGIARAPKPLVDSVAKFLA